MVGTLRFFRFWISLLNTLAAPLPLAWLSRLGRHQHVLQVAALRLAELSEDSLYMYICVYVYNGHWL